MPNVHGGRWMTDLHR